MNCTYKSIAGQAFTGYDSVTRTVRVAANASNLILYAGRRYAMDLAYLLEHLPHDPLGNFAVAWHPYEFKCAFQDGICTGEDGTVNATAVTDVLPLLITELAPLSSATDAYMTGFQRWADSLPVGTVSLFPFCWNPGPYKYHLLDNLSDWAGSNPTAWGQSYKEWQPRKKDTSARVSSNTDGDGASAVNRQLCGVNNEWVNPLGVMVSVNRDKEGRAGSWLPPKLGEWVNQTDPFNSAALSSLLGTLQLGSYRFPGGSIGNWWNWSSDAFSPLANDSFHRTIAEVQQAGFPAGAFGAQRFDQMLQRVGAQNILTLDVSTAGPDPSIPALVVSKLGLERASRFECGNEVYDPRQGPQPGGYATAQDYLADTKELIGAVRSVGGRAGVTIGPCPFFYPVGSNCWGGENGRYHQWHRNLSSACQGSSGGACPFDAIIAHNYVTDVKLIAAFAPPQMLSVFLAVPQVTMDFGAASMKRDFADGLRLWVSEFNTMFASVWGGKADLASPAAAKFVNQSENSAAHAVHVAAYVMAAMKHGSLVEMMNYHSFLEGAGAGNLGPQSKGGSQPGFATAAINDTAAYISPVAQLLSMLSKLLTPSSSTMEAVAASSGKTLPFTLAKAGLGDDPVPCVQAVVICGDVSSTLLAINRCAEPDTVRLANLCGGGTQMSGWENIDVFPATLSAAGPGHTWTRLGDPGPMTPIWKAGGKGSAVTVAPFALSVIELSGTGRQQNATSVGSVIKTDDSMRRLLLSCRDRLAQPFASDSPWNTAIGSGAKFSPALLFTPPHHPLPESFFNDHDYFFVTTAADPLVPVYDQGGWWEPAAASTYCPLRNESKLIAHMPFPAGVTATSWGDNNAFALLMPDGKTLVQSQPIYRCEADSPLLFLGDYIQGGSCHNSTSLCRSISILSSGNESMWGSHGGSDISALGGLIRLGELNESSPPIAHALKLELGGEYYYFGGSRKACYRWPADTCDGSAPTRYTGTDPNVQPGSLLAVPQAVADALAPQLTSVPAKKILDALTSYGGYLVDNTAGNRGTVCGQFGLKEEVEAEYGFALGEVYSPNTTWYKPKNKEAAKAFYNDMLKIYQSLHAVTNSAPGAIGGGGKPRLPPPPPICKMARKPPLISDDELAAVRIKMDDLIRIVSVAVKTDDSLVIHVNTTTSLKIVQTQARAAVVAGGGRRVTLLLDAGIHTLTDGPLVLGSRDSGIAWTGVDGAVISGGTTLPLATFEPVPTTDPILRRLPTHIAHLVVRTDISAYRSSFTAPDDTAGMGLAASNGAPLQNARWPNRDAADSTGVTDGWASTGVGSNASGFRFPTSAPLPANVSGTVAHGFWWCDWSSATLPVTALHDGFAVVPASKVPPYVKSSGKGKFPSQSRFFFLDQPEYLDEAGEWWIDRAGGHLYLLPPVQTSSSSFFLSMSASLFDLNGASSGIEFRGLTMLSTQRGGIKCGADDGPGHMKRCSATSVVIDNCSLIGLGNTAIEVIDGTKWSLTHSNVQYTGGVSVLMTGGNYSDLSPSGHLIANCTISDFNRNMGGFLAGLKISGVGTRVLNNEIARGAAQALLWSGNNHRISANVIHDACMDSFDCGAIYESSRNWAMRGTVIEKNLIFNIGSPATVCNSRTSCGRHAIYLDALSMGFTVRGNVVAQSAAVSERYSTGSSAIVNNGGRDSTIESNLCVGWGTCVDTSGECARLCPSVALKSWQDIRGALTAVSLHSRYNSDPVRICRRLWNLVVWEDNGRKELEQSAHLAQSRTRQPDLHETISVASAAQPGAGLTAARRWWLLRETFVPASAVQQRHPTQCSGELLVAERNESVWRTSARGGRGCGAAAR
jgi:hypothetical protein